MSRRIFRASAIRPIYAGSRGICLGLSLLAAAGYGLWVARVDPTRAGESCAASHPVAQGREAAPRLGDASTAVDLVFTEDESHFMAPSARDAASMPSGLHWLLPRFPVFAVTVTGLDRTSPVECSMVYEDGHWLPAVIDAAVLGSQHRS